MKQVININFHGRVVPIEVTAFEILKQYTESLSRHFAAEEGKEEIINDIENRIGELFQERLKEGATCITDEDVQAVIRSMGRPEDFDTEEPAAREDKNEQQTSEKVYESVRPHRLYRNENEKVFGGVCSGIADYLNIDVVIVRVIFVVLAMSVGFGILTYLILWLAVPSTASNVIGATRKKLYRDPDDKIIGGVCRGLSHYFGINVWIPRLLFLIPLLSFVSRWSNDDNDFNFLKLSFSPGALIIYIILWLVLPEASSTAEKLEMKGEKVDLNSIKNSVVEEMKGVQKRADKISKDASQFAKERSQTFTAEVNAAARRSTRTLGDIIIMLIKILAYTILGIIAFSLVLSLFGFGIVAVGLFPVKDFVLTDGWQNVFAWGTLIFFIIIPIIGIITWLIRRLARIKTHRKMMRLTFFGFWFIGLICFISLITSVAGNFRSTSTLGEEDIYLPNPGISKLMLTTENPTQRFNRRNWLKFEPFEAFSEDTAFVGNYDIHIFPSETDSFRVTMVKVSNGYNRNNADNLASIINFNMQQTDSILLLDRAIAVNKKDKFRNQHVIINVYVPIGKQIRINRNVERNGVLRLNGPWRDSWIYDYEGEENGWETDTDYIMKKEGLYTTDGLPANKWNNRNTRNRNRMNIDENGVEIDNYRYDESIPATKPDSIEVNVDRQQNRLRDSLQKVKEKIDKELDKISEVNVEKQNGIYSVMPTYNPMVIMF